MSQRSTQKVRFAALAIVVLALLAVHTAIAQVVVRGDLVYTMSGDPIENGVVVIEEGKITAVGPASRVRVPQGARELSGAVVTPGLVDVRSTLGLSGAYNSNVGPVRDQDQLETSSPIQPELRAIDAYNPREDLIAYARSHGVTTIHTGHGPGALISGQTMIAKTTGSNVDEALVQPGVMLAATLGELNRDFRSPGTRAKGIAMMRGAFMGARDLMEKQDKAIRGGEGAGESEEAEPPSVPRDLRKEALVSVLRGEKTLMVDANTATEIMSALRLRREFGFKMVLSGAAEAYLVLDEIKESGVPVFVHPPRARIRNKTFEIAKMLHDAGIPFAVQTGHENYVPKTRVLIFETAHYAANGLSAEQALSAITIDAARLLGIDDQVGSLETGKDGDVVLFGGDPFEYVTQVCGVVIEGAVLSDTCH